MDILKEIEIKKGQRLNKATTEAEKTAALNAAYTQARKVKEQRDINAQRKKSADTQIKGIERQTEAGRDLQAAAQNISKEQQLRNLNRDIYMDMLSKGIYDPKAAEALGVSDGAVRGFVAKVQAEIAAKKAAAAKAARGSDDTYYEEDETVTVSPEVQAQRDAERRAMNDDVSGTGQRGVKITAEEQAEAQRVLFGKNPQAAALTADVNEIKGSVKTNNELESAGSKTEGATAVDQLKSGGHYTSVQVQQKKEQAQKVQKMSADYGFDHGTSMVITQLQALTQRYNVETVMATFLKHNKIREDAYSYTQNLVAEYVIASEKGKDRKLTKDEKVFLSLMKESTQLTDEGKQIIDSILIYDFNTIVDEYKARCNDMNDEALLAEYEKPTQGGLYGQYATMISGEELERREAVDREEALSVLGEYTEEDTDLSEAGHISYVVSVIESKLDALIDPDAAISELEAKINAYKQRGADVSGDEEKLRHYRSNYDQLKREYNDSKKKYEEDLAALNAVDRLTLEYYSASKEERKEYSRQGVPSAGKLTTWWQVVENGKDAGMMSDPEDPTGYTQYTNTMPRYSKADYWNRDAKIAGFSFSYNDLTSEEQDIVNYLLGKYPQFISQDFGNSVGVFEYLHSIESRVMRRITADKTASNAFSAIMNQFGAGAEDSIKNMIYNLAQIKSGEYAGNRTRESQYLWQNAIDKYDIGTVGQFVGTALYTAGQQTPRQIVSALYGSAGRIISDVIFGSDIALSVWSEKKAAGWSDVDAMTYTVLDTAFQTVTEHFLDGFNFGTKGTIINAIEGAINKGVKGGLGRILLKQTISAGSEGLEEFVQGLGEYILEYVQTNGQPESELDWSQLLYDAAIGCALGGVGGISNVVLNAPTEVENDRTRRYAGKSEDLYKKINSSYGHAADDAFLTIHTMAGQGYTLAEVKRHAAKNKFILTGGEINKVYAAGKGSFIQSMSKSAEKAYRRATSLDVQKQSAWLTLYNAGLNNEASYAEYIRSHSEAKELAAVIGLQESREAYEFGAEQGKVFDDQIQQQIKVMKQEQRNKAQDADTGAMPAAEPVSASIEQTVTDQTAPNSDTTVGTAPQQVRQQAYDKFDDGSTQYPTAFNAVYLAGKQLGDFDEAYERVSDILSRDAALEIYSAGSIDRGEAGTTDVQITKPASGSYLRYSRSGKDAEFIDGLDFEAYNEITLPAGEYNRVLSEAMTWHADKINQPFLIILEKNYVCIFNKDHELKVIRVEQSGNIHKKEGIYDGSKSDGEKPDTVIGELGYTEGDSYSRGRFSENGGEKGGGDSAGDRPLSQQGKSDGQRRLEHRPVSHRRNKRKLIRFHDNEDGTVTSWYDDGSVETKPKKGKKSAKKKKEVQSLVDDETAKELFIAGMNGVDIGQVVDMDAVTDERLRAEMQRYYDNGKAKEVHLGTAEGIYRQGRGKVIGKRRGVQADVAMMRKFTKLHHLDVEIRDDGSIEGKAAYDVAAFRILMSKSAGDVHFYHEVFENMLAIRPDLFDQLERSMIECFLQTHSLSELEDAVAEYMVAYETKDYALGRKEWVCSYAAKQLATAQGRRAFTEWLDRSDTERTLWEKIVDFFRRIVRSLRAAANGEYIGTAYRKDGDQLSARLGNVITLLDKTRKYQASLRNGQTITVGGGDGNIRYSLPFHSMKKNDVNRIGWADELFSAEDKILLNDRFVDIMIRKDLGDAVRLKGNSYLLDINNKIVIIGGTFNNPVIRFVMVINTDNATYAQEIKEVIFTHEHLKSLTAREASSGISIYETYFGQEVVRGYNSQDFGYNAQSAHIFASLPKGFASYGYTEKQQDGSRVSGEDGGTGKLNYSRDTATVTKEDVEKVKKTLPSADAVAMGEKTAEMDEVARNSGRLPQGERARRDIAVPRKVSGKKTMRWARTFFESGVGEPDMVDPIAEELLNEGLAYKVIGNNKAIGVAEKIVELK
ncbi:MAG: hypothetical protein IKY33_00450, partial [Clostridia bacterium]|nr:hypothetical protein [Clostridia bacterium]